MRRIGKASREHVDSVRRAKALRAVFATQTFSQATASAGFEEARSVSQLVQRFNQQGLAALLMANGRGRKPTSTNKQQERLLQEMQREPDHDRDQAATWSLSLLQDILRKNGSVQDSQSNHSSGVLQRWLPLSAHPHVVQDPGCAKVGR